MRTRNNNVLTEDTISIHANDFYVLANMSFTCAALQTFSARHMHLGRYEVAFLDAGDLITVCHYLAAKFVSGDKRRMNAISRPTIPFINVEVGAANGRDLNLDQHIGAAKSRDFDFANFRARLGFWLYDGQHGIGHSKRPYDFAMALKTLNSSTGMGSPNSAATLRVGQMVMAFARSWFGG